MKQLTRATLPLEAISKASAQEKSIRHGHASMLHLPQRLADARGVRLPQALPVRARCRRDQRSHDFRESLAWTSEHA